MAKPAKTVPRRLCFHFIIWVEQLGLRQHLQQELSLIIKRVDTAAIEPSSSVRPITTDLVTLRHIAISANVVLRLSIGLLSSVEPGS